jgi:hypothetical protein
LFFDWLKGLAPAFRKKAFASSLSEFSIDPEGTELAPPPRTVLLPADEKGRVAYSIAR